MSSERDYSEEVQDYRELLDVLEEAVSKNKLFFSNRSVVLEMIEGLKERLPSEISNAYDVLAKEKQIIARAREDAEDIRKSAENEAEDIIAEANERADELTSQSEIFRRAEEEGQKIYNQAMAYKKSMYDSTNSYVISVLEQAQDKVSNSLDSVKQIYDDVEKNRENFIDFINSKSED